MKNSFDDGFHVVGSKPGALPLLALWAFLMLLPAVAASPLSKGGPSARLGVKTFKARGENHTILTVDHWGRYALTAKSAQGTAIELVDRMMGSIAFDGEAGVKDGRIDLFLDAGSYMVVAHSHANGSGPLALALHSFKELHGGRIPVLREFSMVSGELRDFERVSYRLVLKKRRAVYLQAQGRSLADLRLWLNGSWLTADTPTIRERTPVSGHPVVDCVIATTLDPGRYLVTAYGGPTKLWTGKAGSYPFRLRYGIPAIYPIVRSRRRMSPFGVDLYRLEGPADTAYLYLDRKMDFTLGLSTYKDGQPPGEPDNSVSISKKSADPFCKVSHWRGNNSPYLLLSVKGPPGKTYFIQAMHPSSGTSSIVPNHSGYYWVSTIYSGTMEDNIDASAVGYDSRDSYNANTSLTDVLTLGNGHAWSRRFNLLGSATLFFRVAAAGDYKVTSTGTPTFCKFEPYLISYPRNYRNPPFKNPPCTFSLDTGLYVLTLSPKRKGIAQVRIEKSSLLSTVKSLIAGSEAAPSPVHGFCQFPKVYLKSSGSMHAYHIDSSLQPGVDHGLVVRSYPLTLLRPLPVGLIPGQKLKISFRCNAPGKLVVESAQGGFPSLSLDGRVAASPILVGAGNHELVLSDDSSPSMLFSLRVIQGPTASPGRRAVYLPKASGESLSFPSVSEDAPLFFNLPRKGEKSVILRVKKSSLYRIETTGLLKTACSIRTRTRTRLFSDKAGGVGRNCLVQQYLKSGDYQITVRALGLSTGHLGLRVKRTALLEGGVLSPGMHSSEAIPAGSAIRYNIRIKKKGRYHLWTLGLDKSFHCRLEDGDGWPLMPPSSNADIERTFNAGEYSYMTLPYPVDSVRVTSLERVRVKSGVSGRGPHHLRLNEPLYNTWIEAAHPGDRDLYLLSVPASIHAAISLGNALMQAYLQVSSPSGYKTVKSIAPGEKWRGELSPGNYRLAVECSRKANHLPYAVKVTTDELVAGLSRSLPVPGSTKVSLSKDGVVRLSSSGGADVRGVLEKLPSGEVVASNDDAGDWNFLISRRLKAGEYLLKVFRVGSSGGTTRVSMSVPEKKTLDAAGVPFDKTISMGGKIDVVPLKLPGGEGVLSVRASASSTLGLVLEKTGPRGSETVGRRSARDCVIDVPIRNSRGYRVRVWSVDGNSNRVHLELAFAPIASLSVTAFATNNSAAVIKLGRRSVPLTALEIVDAGTYRVSPDRALLCSTGWGKPLKAVSGLVGMPKGPVWLEWSRQNGNSLLPVSIRPFTLTTSSQASFEPLVAPGERRWVDVSAPPDSYVLLLATSEIGSPACTFAPAGNPAFLDTFALGKSACITVAPFSGPTKVLFWNADANDARPRRFHLELRSFPRPGTPTAIKTGRFTGVLASRRCEDYALPPGPKKIDLSLDAEMTAVFWKENRPSLVVSSFAEPTHRSLYTSALHFTIFNRGGAGRAFATSVWKEKAPRREILTPRQPYERIFAVRGALRIPLTLPRDSGNGWVLHILGGSGCDLLGVDGMVRSGRALYLGGDSGILTVRHGPGLFKAWITNGREKNSARWGLVAPVAPRSLAAGEMTGLVGTEEWFSISISKPCVLHLDSSSPVVIALGTTAAKNAGAPPIELLHVAEGYPSLRSRWFVEPGAYLVGVRGIGEAHLSGAFGYTTESARLLKGPLGPEVLMAPGESRTFSFRVKRKEKVGVGTRADADLLTCSVFRNNGKLLGEGYQQYLTLDAGTYFLRVCFPPGKHTPVHFRPVVLGLAPPPEGPPDKYLKEFLNSIGYHERRTRP